MSIFYSGHHLNIKISIFSSMFLRALHIVSPQYLDQEIEYIRKIGTDLCYPSYLLDICYNKAHKKFYSERNREKETPKNILSLPYFSGFETIKSLLKSFNVNLVFSYNSTLKGMLIKNGPKESNNIIYKIPCLDCSSFYIGQSSKDLEVRIKQHKYSVKTGQTSNAIFIHLSEKSHRINWAESSVIARSKDFFSRNLLESAIIQLTSSCNFNLSPGIYYLDPGIRKMFERDLKDKITDIISN